MSTSYSRSEVPQAMCQEDLDSLYIRNLNLDDTWYFEEIVLGLGKRIDADKLDHTVHPRKIWALMGAFETRYRAELGDPSVSKAEIRDAETELAKYDKAMDEQKDAHKKKFMGDMYSACRNGAQRLKFVELGERGTGKRIVRKRQELEEKIERVDKNLKYLGAVSDALLSTAVAAISYVFTKDVVASIGTGAATTVTRAGDAIAYKRANRRKDQLNEKYGTQIKQLETKLKADRSKITIQTITEVINYLNDDIPGSVIEAASFKST